MTDHTPAVRRPHSLDRKLTAMAPPWGQKYIGRTMCGDPEAADSLCSAMHPEDRGWLAHELYDHRLSVPAFRSVLDSAWNHDYSNVLMSFTDRKLDNAFRYAQFSMPENTPEIVTVYRGGRAPSWVNVFMGRCWTLDYSVACWFAMRREHVGLEPFVLRVKVRRSQVIYYSNLNGENEVIFARQPLRGGDCFPGDQQEWHEHFVEYERAKNEREKKERDEFLQQASG